MPAGIKCSLSKIVTVLGRSYEVTADIYADVAPPFDISLAAAKTGQLTTRTSASVGTFTMQSSHGITTGATIDVYWTDATTGEQKVRYQILVGTVSGTSVPVTLGAGDDLPPNLTSVTAMVVHEEAFVVVGDDVQFASAYSKQGGLVTFAQSDDTVIYAVELTEDNPAWSWTTNDGSDNPFAGATIGKIFLSHPNSTQAVTLRGVVGYN